MSYTSISFALKTSYPVGKTFFEIFSDIPVFHKNKPRHTRRGLRIACDFLRHFHLAEDHIFTSFTGGMAFAPLRMRIT